MLTLSHIRKDYGKFTAVEDINLELENGLYAMLAPNGAGKTTLIKMITTLLYPTSGEILYDGMDIYKMGETYRDVIGYLPQHFGYYKNLPDAVMVANTARKKLFGEFAFFDDSFSEKEKES